jgi:hypothetical protein
MSAIAAPLNASAPGRPDAGASTLPGLGRLTKVELRKMTDTRAGFWLLFSVAGLTAAAVVLMVLAGHGSDHTLRPMLNIAVQPANVLLPVVGILLITSEWSQRTGLITFTLVPRRGRVLVAKLLASLVLAAAAYALAVLLAVLGTAAAGSNDADTWSLGAGLLGQMAVYTATSMLMGLALGAAILVSAPAIVAAFALPLAVSAVTHIIHPLRGVGRWIDQSRTLADLVDHLYSGHEWARVGVTLLVWLVLPLAVGAWRFLRGEIR